jgi:hypothetical protein
MTVKRIEYQITGLIDRHDAVVIETKKQDRPEIDYLMEVMQTTEYDVYSVYKVEYIDLVDNGTYPDEIDKDGISEELITVRKNYLNK